MIILLVQCFVLLEALLSLILCISSVFLQVPGVCMCVCVHVFHIKILLKYLMIFASVHIEI